MSVNVKEKVKSMQFKLFATLCVSTMLVVVVIVIVNNVILEEVYKYTKIQVAKNLYYKINEYYQMNFTYNINSELRQIEIKNNIEVLIEDENGEVEYFGNKDILETLNIINKIPSTIIEKDNNLEIRNYSNLPNNKFIILSATCSNGYKMYAKVPVTAIQESVKISNKALMLLGMVLVAISACLASIISKKFTEPILQLNKITKKMANLDFSEKYDSKNGSEEINALGENINIMSEKLEKTIGQLRRNNDDLEKDVEEKLKIDEMRKQFISDVSHELKTPIGLIQGYAEGLLENVNEDEESRKFYATVIIDEANKMDTMVKELLELMKLEYKERKFKDTEFDLTELIDEEIRRETINLKEENIQVEFDNNKRNIVYADQEYIEQIVNNYFTNAIKHCEEVNNEKKISIICEKRKSGKMRLTIFNTGKKIPEEYINKIWGRFYKVDSSRNREQGGTGIGLALVKAIMNNYGNEYGVINVENGVEFFADINTSKRK